MWLTWHNLHIVRDRAQLATKTEPQQQQQDSFLYVNHIISQVVGITYNIIIIAQTTPPPADDDSFVSHSQSYTEQYELYILLFAIIARHQPTTTTLFSVTNHHGRGTKCSHNESLSPSFLRLNGWLGCKKVAEEGRKRKKGRTLTLLWLARQES